MNFSGKLTIGSGGGGGTTTSPTITDVLDAGSYTKNIAQGSIFVVKGSNLSPSGYTAMDFPLPQSSGGIKITFTPAGGGKATDAYLIYLFNQGGVNQLAAVLPSNVATGAYDVTVTNGSATSATFRVTVVQRKPGIITQDSSGTGLAVVQNYISPTQYDIDRFTTGTITGTAYTISPAHPGQVLIAWVIGLGPVSGSDNTASPGVDFSGNTDIQVLVGDKRIKPLYAGRAPGFAGVDQVNFQLPADVQTGCTVPFQISVAGQVSNTSFISIASGSDRACSAPGITAQQLQDFDQGKSLTVGAFSISQISMSVPGYPNAKFDSASGSFNKITGFQLDAAGRYLGAASDGCQVIRVKGNQSQLQNPITVTGLDAGSITLSGPSGSGISGLALTQDATSKGYYATLGTEGIPMTGPASVTLVPGTYTLNGAGGTDVGAFTVSTSLSSALTITGGLPSSITRSSGLPLAWTGGGASDIVTILGYSGTSSGTGNNVTVDATMFICTTTAGKNGFTVPADILSQLPATSGAGSTGFLEVFSSSSGTQFSPELKAGGKISSLFSSASGTGAQVTYQ